MNAESPSRVAIVTINWNGLKLTERCIKSLKEEPCPEQSIIVVDNGSKNGEGDILKNKFPDVTVLQLPENRGFAGGNNAGIQYALDHGFSLVMIINNDSQVESGATTKLVKEFQSGSWGALQPLILTDKDSRKVWNAGGIINKYAWINTVRWKNQEIPAYHSSTLSADWLTGCCILTSAATLREVGLLNDKYFAYVEDVDWSLRFTEAGYKLGVECSSILYHEGGGSIRVNTTEGSVSPVAHYLNIRNHIFLVKEHAKGMQKLGAWAYQIFKISGYSLYFLTRLRFTKLKFSLLGFLHGLKGVSGPPPAL